MLRAGTTKAPAGDLRAPGVPPTTPRTGSLPSPRGVTPLVGQSVRLALVGFSRVQFFELHERLLDRQANEPRSLALWRDPLQGPSHWRIEVQQHVRHIDTIYSIGIGTAALLVPLLRRGSSG